MRAGMARWLLLAALFASAHPWAAAAQSVRDCDTFEANARNTYAPYTETIRHYANGDIRVIALDVGEPALSSFHLMVTYPARDEPFALCSLISGEASSGFYSLDMGAIAARYDPAQGLIVSLPVQNLIGGDAIGSAVLFLTINQALGTVVAAYNEAATAPPPAPPAGATK
jgi:hypothetical protein